MRPFNIPPQLVRLCLLTVGIVGFYLIARYLLTPESFGQFGWYRGHALEEVAAREPHFAGKEACDQCHAEVFKVTAEFAHKSISCESCHGPGQAHVEDPDVKTAHFTDLNCLRCHENQPGRPAWFKQVIPKEHYPADRCAECHDAHKPNET